VPFAAKLKYTPVPAGELGLGARMLATPGVVVRISKRPLRIIAWRRFGAVAK
jgi:hypothetical protein